MDCPNCKTVMREREKETRGGLVVLDVCPNCGGVWLDKGELEKVSSAESRYYDRDEDNDDDSDDDNQRRSGPARGQGGDTSQGKRRRGGFLSNLFEGFGGD